MVIQAKERKVQLSVTVRPELKAAAKEIARENNTTPSGIISQYLEELSRTRKEKLMIEYYQAIAKEERDFAKKSAKVVQRIAATWSD
jgi:hypothetical protein